MSGRDWGSYDVGKSLVGTVYAMQLYNVYLSDASRQAVENYFGTLFGVSPIPPRPLPRTYWRRLRRWSTEARALLVAGERC